MTSTARAAIAEVEDGDDLLYMEEVSAITRMTIDTLRYLRHQGDGPPSFRLGRRVVYPRSGLRAWIRDCAERDAASREPTSVA